MKALLRQRAFISESPVHTRYDWFYHYIFWSISWLKATQLMALEVEVEIEIFAETIVNNSRLTIDCLDCARWSLIDLPASIADVMESSAVFAQGDAVRPRAKESDLIVGATYRLLLSRWCDCTALSGGELRSVIPMLITLWWNRLWNIWNLKELPSFGAQITSWQALRVICWKLG